MARMNFKSSWMALAGASALGVTLIACAPQAEAAGTAPVESAVAAARTGNAVQGEIKVSGPPPQENGNWKSTILTQELQTPWGMTWLPDGRILITEKGGGLAIWNNGTLTRDAIIGGPVPAVVGQGGLMDVSIHPRFKENNWVYFTLATGDRNANHTAVARGVLRGTQITDLKIIFQTKQAKGGGQHFGSRILWLKDGTFLVSIGDGGNPPASTEGKLNRWWAQELNSHLGKVLRLDENGKAPKDNPFVKTTGAFPEVWSLGHRNIQGMALDPASGRIFANEHGAQGGDELNRIEASKNYGWPKVSYSQEYGTQTWVSPDRSLAGLVDPMVVWTPCPAPSGLVFYTGDKFAAWKGDLFSGGLAGNDIRRVDLDANGRVVGQTRLPMPGRIRDVRQGPDGFLYAITDERSGKLIRIEPAN
ncbi:MAG: PQQ-dependent sugar dehydrogenase [Armatimonadetes bacterium]|nr:PQQ-dependent sugar dehydrogenase [Armatimonadota bacterium]